MNLYTKIIISTMMPLIFITLVTIFQIKNLIDEIQINLDKSYKTQSDMVAYRLDDLASNQNYAVRILSSAPDIASAAEINDNSTLFDWGMNFLSDKVKNFIFIDTEGLVISRAPDEYRFGDCLANSFVYKRLKKTGHYFGIAIIDGDEQLVSGRIIKKYGEYPVGYVITSTPINKELTNYLGYGVEGVVGYKSDSKVLLGEMNHPKGIKDISIRYVDNEVKHPSFHIHFADNPEHLQLVDMKHRMQIMSFGAFVMIIMMLLVIFRIHFKPYKLMLEAIASFNSKKLSIDGLKSALLGIRSHENVEVANVINGLTGMIDMVQTNIGLLNNKNELLDKLSKTDGLTSLFNRMYMDAALTAEANRADRYGSTVSVIMLDIDHFKNINDKFGHQTGDKVLIELSRLLMRNTRNTDITGRWGGEEFLIICAETNLHDAVLVGEKIHAILNCTELADVKVTVSMGISEYKKGETVHSLVKRADDAMYNAKMSRRNCIRT